MSEQTADARRGLFDSLKGFAASLVAIVHTRLDLLSTDVEEARDRLISALVMLVVALFCLGVGVLLLALLIVVAFWDTHRLLALAGVTIAFLAGGMAAFGGARHILSSGPKLFAASLAELAKDRQHLTQRP